MMDIRGGFFYTRPVPCQLWFLDKDKPGERLDKVLMVDARNVSRKVTRTIFDFSPEQLKNLASIVWLYKGQTERFLNLVAEYLYKMYANAEAATKPLANFMKSHEKFLSEITPFVESLNSGDKRACEWEGMLGALETVGAEYLKLKQRAENIQADGISSNITNTNLHAASESAKPLSQQTSDLIKNIEFLYKTSMGVKDKSEKELEAKSHDTWSTRKVNKLKKNLAECKENAISQLKLVTYFYKQALWLQSRFPDAVLRNVDGLVKMVDITVIKDNDWSLTPGLYVGVAPEEEDDEFIFEEALRDIHIEIAELNDEAQRIAAQITMNLEELGL